MQEVVCEMDQFTTYFKRIDELIILKVLHSLRVEKSEFRSHHIAYEKILLFNFLTLLKIIGEI